MSAAREKSRPSEIPLPTHTSETPRPERAYTTRTRLLSIAALAILSTLFRFSGTLRTRPFDPPEQFYQHLAPVKLSCAHGMNTTARSIAGHIGLRGDTEDAPKRSFFWYFEAEEDPENAPAILTMGGGPGTSGMMNALWGQSPCMASEHDGFVSNPNRWTQKHHLIALDHPVGAGFSYGAHVNNSRDAAYDVYDFLQKVFEVLPHRLQRHKLVISGGSYGGIYVPNIATVIHEQNLLVAAGKGRSHAKHLNLDALVLTNPLSNPQAHLSWLLHFRCVEHQIYNSTQCTELYAELPKCLDALQMAFTSMGLANRRAAAQACGVLASGDIHGVDIEDIRKSCDATGTPDRPAGCHDEFLWVKDTFDNATTRVAMGLPPAEELAYSALNLEVNAEFAAEADIFRPHHLLYTELLAAGIRVLHYIGAQDANCALPGVLSFLNLLPSPYQSAFRSAPDLPWALDSDGGVATVRAVGDAAAGNMVYIRVDGAGHFTVKDQPALAKRIVETWVANEPWF
ncbi:hypothetical protein MKEN_00985800 [Mycena kentingensis (nom. inval.)]|nr:hypothetical protein MKEN_00985800 [Mycena kentingensis (nom. inval.)]